MNRGITKENVLFTLPPAIKGDTSTEALAEATAEVLADRVAEIDRLRIVPNIDNLEEALLAILARDFKVDWWDPEYSIEEKRQTVKDSWRVHKTLGTKAAVETAIRAIYPRTRVLEWWEYDGEPYHFRLDINITNDHIDSEKQRRVLERLNFYKSLRSHNDGVTYFVEAVPAIARAASSVTGFKETTHVSLAVPVPIIQPTASARVGAITGLWESGSARINLDAPALRKVSIARVRATAGVQEVFTSCTVMLETQAPTATAQARARGAVAARQEAAQTTINFSRR